MPPKKTTAVVVDDDLQLRKQLALRLESTSDLKCLALLASGEEALEQVPVHSPDVLLMEINLPGISGIECATRIKEMCPSTEIIIHTVYEDSDNIFSALKAGASGYLLKSSHPKDLLHSIRNVCKGGVSFSSQIARKILEFFRSQRKSPTESPRLTTRENEIMLLLAAGYPYKEIGFQLGIEAETVRVHVKSICRKMHARNRVEAVAKFRI